MERNLGEIRMFLSELRYVMNRMKNILNYFIVLLSLFLFQSGGLIHQYDPWGIWNTCFTPCSEDEKKIRTIGNKKYYEIAMSGLWTVKKGKDYLYKPKENYSLIAIEGDHTKIEKYEAIEDGFIFYLVGDGFRYSNGRTDFQDNTRIQVKMHFLSEDECYFEYVSLRDENGFHLSYFPEENVTYKRFRP